MGSGLIEGTLGRAIKRALLNSSTNNCDDHLVALKFEGPGRSGGAREGRSDKKRTGWSSRVLKSASDVCCCANAGAQERCCLGRKIREGGKKKGGGGTDGRNSWLGRGGRCGEGQLSGSVLFWERVPLWKYR